jgi:hypothetical protein
MSGTAAAGVTTWSGNVSVDESTDGTSWSTVKDHLNDLGVSTKMYTIRVKPSSRYVRFYYKSKASGFNLAIDDVTINPAPAGDAPELQVSYNGKKLIHNSTVKTGNDTLIQLKVLNNSKAAELNISDIQLTGSQNTFFKLLNVAQMKIAAGDSAIVQVKLNATAEGTYNVNVTFTSNDTLNNPFTVILSTIKGQFASQPTLQPTALDVTAKAWRMNGKFTVAVGAESYLVVCSKGSSSDMPVDGAQYQRGQYIGNSRVIYVGTNNANIDFDNVVANTNYVVRVFSFNGYGAYSNYLTTAPLLQSVTSLYGWYRKMNALKHSQPALANGNQGAPTTFIQLNNTEDLTSLLAFERTLEGKTVIVVANISEGTQSFKAVGNYVPNEKNIYVSSQYELKNGEFILPSFGYVVFTTQN